MHRHSTHTFPHLPYSSTNSSIPHMNENRTHNRKQTRTHTFKANRWTTAEKSGGKAARLRNQQKIASWKCISVCAPDGFSVYCMHTQQSIHVFRVHYIEIFFRSLLVLTSLLHLIQWCHFFLLILSVVFNWKSILDMFSVVLGVYTLCSLSIHYYVRTMTTTRTTTAMVERRE